MAHFHIENLTFSYAAAKGKKSLDEVSFDVEQGEFLVVCGSSGSGKSTLLRHLKPVLAPNGRRQGEIYFNQKPLRELTDREQASEIGFVMQNPDDQIVTDKVWHELAFGLESLGFRQQTMRARVAEMACYFGIQDWFHRDVSTLSGGQKQLLNLASVMAMQPEVLILDEPTSQLDPIAAGDFLNTVRKINSDLGTTVIMTEHRLEDIFPYADRALVMDHGRIIAHDRPSCVGQFLFENHHKMFSAMPTPVRVFYGTGCTGQSPLTVRQGRSWLSREFPHGVNSQAEAPMPCEEGEEKPAVSLKEVWFRYEKKSSDILRGVSAEIPSGKLYAILGGNGAGKSTTLKTIAGICRPYRGQVRLLGKTLDKYRPGEIFKGCLAMLPQDPKSLFVRKTVYEDLREMTEDESRLKAISELCQITEILNQHPYDLSGGEQQRAALAKVLLTQPKILLLDEPTKGIDCFFKKNLADILENLKKKGVTIIMVSHDVEFCAQYADLTAMFFDGQILTTDTPAGFFGSNSFYTTAAHRMSRHIFERAVTADELINLYRENKENAP